MCQETDEPIFITKNGYGSMVLMSMKTYEEKMLMLDVHDKLNAAEKQLAEEKVIDGELPTFPIVQMQGWKRTPS